MFGTDFSILAQMFPGCDRRHLKNKYIRELRVDPDRVERALRRKRYDANEYDKVTQQVKKIEAEKQVI